MNEHNQRIIDENRVCCFSNIGSHYRLPIYKLMHEELDCDFFLGDKLKFPIAKFDYSEIEAKTLSNHFLGSACWQSGVLKLAFMPYKYYIINDDPHYLSSMVFLLLARLKGKITISWSHGWYGKEKGLRAFAKRIFLKNISRHLIYNERNLELLHLQGIPYERLFCIYNSLDSDLQRSIRDKLKKTTVFSDHFGNDFPVINYTGRIQRVKQIDKIIESVYTLIKDGTDVNLVIVGKDSENVGLEEVVSKLGIEKNVWFYGPCYDEKRLGELFYNSAVTVSPGNIGLTAIHSLSYGCPIITHDNLNMQMPEYEAMTPGINGDFYKCGDYSSLTSTIKQWVKKSEVEREIARKEAFKTIDEKWNIHYQIKVLKKVFDK